MVRANSIRVCVDGNVVVADGELERLTVGVGEERLRFLEWHVAVDAVVGDLRAQGSELSALLGLVAVEAVFRERGSVALDLMDVVAGDAGHVAGPEAAALFE